MKATRAQIRVSHEVVRWYFETHFGTQHDPGLPRMFFDVARVGPFVSKPEEFAAGESDALHRMLVAMIMFQRRQDVQIARILRGMDRSIADEIMRPRRLLRLIDQATCPHLASTDALHTKCDLTKVNGVGTCRSHASVQCHLKRHTVALKRYGHFGKFPTSAALLLRELHVRGLRELYERVLRDHKTPEIRAEALITALSRVWRVSDKIAAMFLSAVSNPDLGAAPWQHGIDWTRFVVVDSNVDLFLAAIGYRGLKTYDARRTFVIEIARAMDLRQFNEHVQSFNPRLVQQAMYLFMSSANRRALEEDCMHEHACEACPAVLSQRCPVGIAPKERRAS